MIKYINNKNKKKKEEEKKKSSLFFFFSHINIIKYIIYTQQGGTMRKMKKYNNFN